MARYYCKWCGESYQSISSLTSFDCTKHPYGMWKGKHELYEGSEKSRYYCKWCGESYRSIETLTSLDCPKHPNGRWAGKHSPAL